MTEIPTPERVLAGESFFHDAEGNARAVCAGCGCAIDLEFDDYVEMAITRKRGLGMERGGRRWFVCGGCAALTLSPTPSACIYTMAM